MVGKKGNYQARDIYGNSYSENLSPPNKIEEKREKVQIPKEFHPRARGGREENLLSGNHGEPTSDIVLHITRRRTWPSLRRSFAFMLTLDYPSLVVVVTLNLFPLSLNRYWIIFLIPFSLDPSTTRGGMRQSRSPPSSSSSSPHRSLSHQGHAKSNHENSMKFENKSE